MSLLVRDRRHKDGAFPLRIPQNRPSNSLRHRTLPVSPFAVTTLRVIFFYLHQNKEFRVWGGGGTQPQFCQTGQAAWRTMIAP
jgi:hypothetical protein